MRTTRRFAAKVSLALKHSGLYKEMQRDLRYYNAMVAIILVIDSDDIERMVNEFFVNAKPDQVVTC